MKPFPAGLIIFLSLALSVISPAQDPCKITLGKKADKLYQEGITWLRKGNYTQANLSMKGVVNDEPACADAWYVLGLVNVKKSNNNLKEAERCFLKTLELCPTYDIYASYYLGEIYYGKEQYEQAVKYLTVFLADVDKIKKDEDYNRAIELLNYSNFFLEITKNPVPFTPRVVEGISTPEDEYLPILSPDNQMALYTREVKVLADKNALVQAPRMKETFMFSMQEEDGSFTEGEPMPAPFNISDNEGGATLTADNNTLYYTICKYEKGKNYLNCDIWVSENVGGEWTQVRNAGSAINLPGSWESQPTISPDGQTLYFVSDRNGGYGAYDIWVASRDDKGNWSQPVNAGPMINSAGNEKSPFLHPDGHTLYFSSDGWMGLGGYDIFITHQHENGTWTKPKNIGFPINSVDDEVGFFASTDGNYGYFASNKYNGKGGWDLYSFDLYEGARPEKVLFIKGTVKTESTAEPVKARIELRNLETKKISQIPLDSMTGNYVAVAPFRSDYIMTVKKEGHVTESKYIAKVDSMFRLPAKVDIEIQPIELNKSYRINDIYFPFNAFDLTPESQAVLDQLIQFLQENPTISIQIQGHTDNIGNDAANLKLSENRAKSVWSYLVEKGIDGEHLTYKGFGKSMPVETNDTEEGRARNRRTVFVITKK
jgi:outer membrane protein OmpA-like peptidoglycan-associated protein/tetratricopeptide (TPR) repeat protein